MSKNMAISPEENKWAQLSYRLVISTICHPLDYGKTLIQLGHEPIAPFRTKTLFGRPAKGLPGIFEYVNYIKKVDGLTGCYKGVGLRICAFSIGSLAQTATLEELQENDPCTKDDSQWEKFKKTIGYEMTARIVGTVASQPFNVCAVRCMAQFVGRETKYNGIVSCVREIYSEEGIPGFFAGLMPRVWAEVCHILIVAALSYIVNNYLLKDEDPHYLFNTSVNFIASSITYPFLVVSNCMIVNNCGLAAGLPPNMPLYSTWRHCFWDLYAKNQLKRGSSLLWRYASA